jgi:2-methylisocitrate lyase-like PEP mutase family enzyme
MSPNRTGARVWRTRSPGCRRIRRRAPTCCTHRALTGLADIRQLVTAVDRPLNVLVTAGVPPVGDVAGAGVSRVSVGGGFAYAALGAVVDAATELRDKGTYGYLAGSAAGRKAIQRAL